MILQPWYFVSMWCRNGTIR